MQITYNKTRRKSKPVYIVVHDTGNRDNGADADAHFNYYNGGNRNSSADIFIDDKKILKINDYHTYYTWHCGDGKGKYGITNANSVGVEICINSDGNYAKAVENAVVAVYELMHELDIPLDRVVRHYDASRKMCPATMSSNSWKAWKDFKTMLTEKVNKATGFSDTKGHYAELAIKDLLEMGIVKGDGNGKFRPDDSIKRGDVAILIRNTIKHIVGK